MKNFKDIILYHIEKYPEIMVEDLYKLLFQASFGPGHLINDCDRALNYLKEELSLELKDDIKHEEIGNGYIRLYLNGYNIEDADWILKMMLDSIKIEKDIDFFMNAYEQSCDVIKTKKGNEFLKAFIEFVEKMISLDLPAVHHSETYRKKYNPHYRVIKKV